MFNKLVKLILLSMLIVGSLNAALISYVNNTNNKMNLQEQSTKSLEVIDYLTSIKRTEKFKNIDDVKKFMTPFVHPNLRSEFNKLKENKLKKYINILFKLIQKISHKKYETKYILIIKDRGKKIKIEFKNNLFEKKKPLKIKLIRFKNTLYLGG
jgi:hypothetical protein